MNNFRKDSATVLRQYALLLVVAVVPLFFGCSSQEQPTEPEQLDLHFEQELAIGDSSAAALESENPILASPTEIRTDGAGRIYITDGQTAPIHVYDRKGTFLHAIGRNGRGPGEFRYIPKIEIDNNNHVITIDAGNNTVSQFTPSGELQSVHSPDESDFVWPEYYRQLSSGRYLFLEKPREIPGTTDPQKRRIQSSVFHVYDSTLTERLVSLGQVDSLMDYEENFIETFVAWIGSGYFWPTKSGDVWYVPGVYDGRLFQFEKTSNGWKMNQVIQGHRYPGEPVELDVDKEGSMTVTIYTREGSQRSSFKVNSYSLGVFTLSDGRIVHFSNQLRGEERITLVEVFSPEGRLEGVGQLDDFTFPGTERQLPIENLWKDENDRFYLVDNRNIPVVRVGRIAGL